MSVAALVDRLEIALVDFNFEWSLVQMRQVVDYWYDGKSIYDMAELLNRKPDEIILLIVDFARGRVLPPRPYGLNANNRIFISKKHLRDKKDNLRRFVQDSPVYIPFIEKNFVWNDWEIKRFRDMWEADDSIIWISKQLNRDIDEVLFLIIDQAGKGFIDPRKNGLLGKDATEHDLIRQRLPF
ncbi:hypothetical protein P9C27_10550 [Bacillus vallismortis]|uniref:hypothetical protein n=1 Tax=Bacillus vallismortis TaxID=72361 RepID=UPI002DBAF6A1|nr:hypothetical protein [Bacillus vallismortis]MEC1268973.1 hypothetical protein [Bacillus vallismortis]